jgi:hypothetical protein
MTDWCLQQIDMTTFREENKVLTYNVRNAEGGGLNQRRSPCTEGEGPAAARRMGSYFAVNMGSLSSESEVGGPSF